MGETVFVCNYANGFYCKHFCKDKKNCIVKEG